MTHTYNIEQVVEVTGLSRRTIYREIERGNLKARKAGSRTLVLSHDLEQYLRSLPRLKK